MAKIRFTHSQLTSGVITPLLILAILLLGYFVLLPKYREVKSNRAVLQQKQAEVQTKQSQLSSIQALVDELLAKRQELESIDEALPPAPYIPELLANFDHLAKQSGVLISNLSVSTPADSSSPTASSAANRGKRWESILSSTEKLGAIDIDLSINGQYANLKTFLMNVEQNLRLLDIKALVLGSTSERSQNQEFSVKLQTYYQKE